MDQGGPSPDDIPRSPTGRVPKWVMDEALGNAPTEAVPFRAPPSTSRDFLETTPQAAHRRRGRWFRAIAVFAVLGLIVFGITRIPLRSLNGSPVPAAAHPLNAPPPGQGASARRLAPAPKSPQPVSTKYAFLELDKNSSAPVTWSPCRAIHYVVRTQNAPLDGARMLRESFAMVSKATGLVFTDDGLSTETPSKARAAYLPDRYGDRWAPVLVAWVTPREFPEFRGDRAGQAGPTSISYNSGPIAYVSGQVLLDAPQLVDVEKHEGETAARSIVLHELGHLVGLDHVNDPTQLMNPRNSPGINTYQRGDLTGLAKLGNGPCLF